MLLYNYSSLVLSVVLLAQAVAHLVYIITADSAVNTDLQRGDFWGYFFNLLQLTINVVITRTPNFEKV